jgi:hypothetical protein
VTGERAWRTLKLWGLDVEEERALATRAVTSSRNMGIL